jgi:hypothetical protein
MRQVWICAVAVLGVLAIAAAAAATPTNRITVAVPAYVVQGEKNTYNITVSGYSRRAAIAYLFLDYSGCARSYAAEHQRPREKPHYYSVRGRFTQTTGWASSGAGTDHACAYLISRASGTLLAHARVSFIVH